MSITVRDLHERKFFECENTEEKVFYSLVYKVPIFLYENGRGFIPHFGYGNKAVPGVMFSKLEELDAILEQFKLTQ